MIGVYVVGVAFILIGVAMLAFPGWVRALDELSNDMRGVRTEHGEAYEAARQLRGLLVIFAGIGILLLPAIVKSM
jgi:uncharacterized membrane protein HdeD (DUF308 family)